MEENVSHVKKTLNEKSPLEEKKKNNKTGQRETEKFCIINHLIYWPGISSSGDTLS